MYKNVDVVFRNNSGVANVVADLLVKQGIDRSSLCFSTTKFPPFPLSSLFGLSGPCLSMCFLHHISFWMYLSSFNEHVLLCIKK